MSGDGITVNEFFMRRKEIAGDLRVWQGLCCTYNALWCGQLGGDMGCMGCARRQEFLCCACMECCRPNTKGFGVGMGGDPTGYAAIDDGICQIRLPCCVWGLTVPRTCCQDQGYFFCCWEETTFPCVSLEEDQEGFHQPMVFGLYGCVCMPVCGCCPGLDQMIPKDGATAQA